MLFISSQKLVRFYLRVYYHFTLGFLLHDFLAPRRAISDCRYTAAWPQYAVSAGRGADCHDAIEYWRLPAARAAARALFFPAGLAPSSDE